jgi:hypothetical protein
MYDPAVGAGRWGWAALAEHDRRVAWLAGLAHDDGAVPIAYVEAPDLGRLCGSVRACRDRFEAAREWLDGRWLRAQVVRGEAGVPELHVGLGLANERERAREDSNHRHPGSKPGALSD